MFSSHSDSRNPAHEHHKLRQDSRWRCPTRQHAYLCRRCHFPHSLAGRYSYVPGLCWYRWHFCHSCVVHCHNHHALQGGKGGEGLLSLRRSISKILSCEDLEGSISGTLEKSEAVTSWQLARVNSTLGLEASPDSQLYSIPDHVYTLLGSSTSY